MNFAVEVLNLCGGIKGHFSITNQLEGSATSIGANIHEANYAQSKADFIAKLQIALKNATRQNIGLNYLSNQNCLTAIIPGK